MAGIEIGACPKLREGHFLPSGPRPIVEKKTGPAQQRSLFRHDKSPTSRVGGGARSFTTTE